MREIKRGDIYYANLNPVVGSEQGGIRPTAIIQNNMGNRCSPTVIIAAITSQTGKARLPTHIRVRGANCGLKMDSLILLEQVRTIDRSRLREYVGSLDAQTITEINTALAVSMGLQDMEGKYDE